MENNLAYFFVIGLNSIYFLYISFHWRLFNSIFSTLYKTYSYLYLGLWKNGGRYLTTYLTMLQEWQCEELQIECENPTYAFNDFTKLVYTKFCNNTKYQMDCKTEIASTLNLYALHNNYTTDDGEDWDKLISDLHSTELTSNQLLNPCIGVALFDKVGIGRYFEIIYPHLPFCDMIWAGLDVTAATRFQISPWFVMSLG